MGKSVVIGGVRFKAYSVQHSIRAPAVGYRVSAQGRSFFYLPDVAWLPNASDALRRIDVYIGDGATIRRPLIRQRAGKLIGHVSMAAQLDWCQKAHVRLDSGGITALTEIPGVGPRIAGGLAELALTGRWMYLERLRGSAEPRDVFCTIPGVGPVLTKRLHETLNVETLEQLEAAFARKGRSRDWPAAAGHLARRAGPNVGTYPCRAHWSD
jgi:predicted flap endonuclease-1-like 5' DNA nuclease